MIAILYADDAKQRLGALASHSIKDFIFNRRPIMSSVSILFQEIMSNSSRDAKIKILENEHNNSAFTQALSFLLS